MPPGAPDRGDARRAVDGLVFSGGSDLDPELYGEEAHAETNGVVRERDDFELELMRAALERDLPVLAICRGSQVLNVALGGGIEQHVPDRVGTDVAQGDARRVRRARRGGAARRRGWRRSSATGTTSSRITTRASASSAEGLREAARAPDGTTEALEDPTKRFTLGVLWHPEEGEDRRLFEALVAEAAAYRADASRLTLRHRPCRGVTLRQTMVVNRQCNSSTTARFGAEPRSYRSGGCRGEHRSTRGLSTTLSSRGCYGQPLFEDDVQHELFLVSMRRVAAKYSWVTLTWALMPNHHALRRSGSTEGGLSEGMRELHGMFSGAST